MNSAVLTPAQSLTGLTLNGNWNVVSAIVNPSTGGFFSQSYIVVDTNGNQAFLKAIDYTVAIGSPDPARALQVLTSEYLFERNLLENCRINGLNRVVRMIDHGEVTIDPNNIYSRVSFMIFEYADDGDIRRYLDSVKTIDLVWIYRSLMQLAASLTQLHGVDVAHQDIKPSNILSFSDKPIKVTDLGRASIRGTNIEHDSFPVAGDPTYSPPEHLYGYIASDWNERRFGCDAYHFGSMIYTLFTHLSITSVVLNKLDASHRPINCSGSYTGIYSSVLPYIQNAFSECILDFETSYDFEDKSTVITILKELCEPDVNYRGHPKDRASHGNSFSLRRYTSIFERLAKKQELSLHRTS